MRLGHVRAVDERYLLVVVDGRDAVSMQRRGHPDFARLPHRCAAHMDAHAHSIPAPAPQSHALANPSPHSRPHAHPGPGACAFLTTAFRAPNAR